MTKPIPIVFCVAVLVACTAPSQEAADAAKRAEVVRMNTLHEQGLRHAEARAVIVTNVLAGAGAVIVLVLAGLGTAAVAHALNHSRVIRPGRDGQLPVIIRHAGGAVAYVDLNRLPAGVAVVRAPRGLPALRDALWQTQADADVTVPLSDDADAQMRITSQAQLVQGIAASTRHVFDSKRIRDDVTEALQPPVIPPYRAAGVTRRSVPIINGIKSVAETGGDGGIVKPGSEQLETKAEGGAVVITRAQLRSFVQCPTPNRRAEWTGDPGVYQRCAAFCIAHGVLERRPDKALRWLMLDDVERLQWVEKL